MPDSSQSKWRLRRIAVVVLILGLAAAIRLYDIGEESLWLDEAVSFECSQPRPIGELLSQYAAEGREPLYYFSLSTWRRLFGHTEPALRGYSTVCSLLALVMIFLLARDIGGWPAGVLALVVGTVDALDIYYAQETRSYAQAAALGIMTSWFLWRWLNAERPGGGRRRILLWAVLYVLAAAAALLTHYLAVFVLMSQGIFFLAWFGRRREWRPIAHYAGATVAVILIHLPWLLAVGARRGDLQLGRPDWIPSPQLPDYYAFLGREFVWGLTNWMQERWWRISLVLPAALFALLVWRTADSRTPSASAHDIPRRWGILYALWLLACPVVLVGITGAVYGAIYWRPRFAMLILPPFCVLAGIACGSFSRWTFRLLAVAPLVAILSIGAWVQQTTIQKNDWRPVAAVWRREGPPALAVFIPYYFARCVGYYTGGDWRSATREQIEEQWPSLGGRAVWVCHVRRHPIDDPAFYSWLMTLGRVRLLESPDHVVIQSIRIGDRPERSADDGKLTRWYLPMNCPGEVEGFEDPACFHAIEFDVATGIPFRWSRPAAWISLPDSDTIERIRLRVELPPPVEPSSPGLRVFAGRGHSPEALWGAPPVATVDEFRPGSIEIEFDVPHGDETLRVGWIVNGVNLARAGISNDNRELGLRVLWVGVVGEPE